MQKNLNIEKIIFKVVQIKFLAIHMHNIFMEHDLNMMIFDIQ